MSAIPKAPTTGPAIVAAGGNTADMPAPRAAVAPLLAPNLLNIFTSFFTACFLRAFCFKSFAFSRPFGVSLRLSFTPPLPP